MTAGQNVKITYLAHSGFVVEFPQFALVFDYYKGELPKTLQGKKLYVFASHFHEDHFKEKIFEWAGDFDVTYILSKDISAKRIPAYVHALRVSARKEYEVDGLKIFTLHSTDIGVAFLVMVQGLTFYHAGDLNWWRWKEETKAFNNNQEADYKRELVILNDYLSKENLKIDLAFLPLDYRQEEDYALGFDWFMKHVGASYAFPMHLWGVYKVIRKLINDDMSVSYRDRIISLSKRGEEFFLCL